MWRSPWLVLAGFVAGSWPTFTTLEENVKSAASVSADVSGSTPALVPAPPRPVPRTALLPVPPLPIAGAEP